MPTYQPPIQTIINHPKYGMYDEQKDEHGSTSPLVIFDEKIDEISSRLKWLKANADEALVVEYLNKIISDTNLLNIYAVKVKSELEVMLDSYKGVKFKRRNKEYVETVIGYIISKNEKGEVVKSCFVSTHKFAGQTVVNTDVARATVDMNKIEEVQHE